VKQDIRIMRMEINDTYLKPTTAKNKYKQPPIQEAVCEIHFKIGQPLDQEALKKIEPVWLPEYPLKNVVAERQIQLQFSVEKMESKTVDIGHKLVMRSADGKNLAQLAATFMAVNKLSPYQGWSRAFRDQIISRFQEVQSIYGIETITQIGLRYIDRIEFPQSPLRWSEWFAVTLPIPNGKDVQGGDFQSFSRQKVGDGMISQINFATLPPLTPETTSVLLDIDVILTKDIPANAILEALEQVHSPHLAIFEGFLLDKTRNLFNI
jgi:uncharacterized protein (TIGR04255 family)